MLTADLENYTEQKQNAAPGSFAECSIYSISKKYPVPMFEYEVYLFECWLNDIGFFVVCFFIRKAWEQRRPNETVGATEMRQKHR